MTLAKLEDQEQAVEILTKFEILQYMQPDPPNPVRDSLCQIDEDAWLAVTNVAGHYTIYFLDEATKAEAWEFFDSLQAGCKHTNRKIHFVGAEASTITN